MLYKATLKPVWTYGIQLWEQHVTNETIHRELKIPTVKEEISKFSNRYNIRVNNHQNPVTTYQKQQLRNYLTRWIRSAD